MIPVRPASTATSSRLNSSNLSSSSSSSSSSVVAPRHTKVKVPELSDFLATGDFTGAVTLLEFQLRTGEGENTNTNTNALSTDKLLAWLGYCAFHNADYSKASNAYEELIQLYDYTSQSDPKSLSRFILTPPMARLCKACCLYFQGLYEETEKLLFHPDSDIPNCSLKYRLLLHLGHRLNKENIMIQALNELKDNNKEDALSKAAMHYSRSHYQEATDIYKKILLEAKDDAALHAYIAACYYRLDYYDVSLEILAVYLQSKPQSPSAINLKACNHFKVYNGKAAEVELKTLLDATHYNIEDNILMKHNLVIFRNGEGALRVLPALLNILPEARLNLIIYHLRNNAVAEAYALVKEIVPTSPQECILSAVVHACMGQRINNREYLKIAQQQFHLVGSNPSEVDTIPGRQAMASCLFLMRQFEEVNIYLQSIKSYMYNDDDFHWNYGITLAAIGDYKTAEETLALITSRELINDTLYVSWMARCAIMNGRPRTAWELYLRMDTSPDSVSLLLLIANDCYRVGAWYWAAKAFDVLERFDPDPEYWAGKRGACIGVFQAVIAGQETKDTLRDIISILRNTNNPQVTYIVNIMERWAAKSGGL